MVLVPELAHLADDRDDGDGTYRDSGMQWHADLTEAADHLVTVLREVRSRVLVTYDQFGARRAPESQPVGGRVLTGGSGGGARRPGSSSCPDGALVGFQDYEVGRRIWT